MNVTIRPAVKEDCAEMLELVKELAVYERAPDEVTVTLDHFIETGFGEKPVWWAYVACATPEDGSPTASPAGGVTPPLPLGEDRRGLVGFALYYIRYSTWKGKKMYLEDILVTEQWRCKGIGSKLMDELIREAKKQDFQGITWQVLEWNEPAFQFYRKYDPVFDHEWVNVMLNFRA
jgi:ribosomal protein S18 acetylase RimI-like enzyme